MATDKQIAANRRNAEKSTGPRTPAGKARCARNALKHGLAAVSAHAFLTVEDRRAFDKMLEGALLAFAPQHADEVELLVDATYCKWRQKRLWNVETTLIEMTIAEKQHDLQRKLPKANAAAHVANAVHLNAEAGQLNRRYEAQLHRQYVRNIKLLRELQADRLNDEPTLDTLYPEDPPVAPNHQPAEQPNTNIPPHTTCAKRPDPKPQNPRAA
jgi:hypothetical protein